MRSSLAGLAAILLCATAAGCSCGSGGPGTVGGDPAGPLYVALCDFQERCPADPFYPIAYSSPAECANILRFASTCRVVRLDDDEVPPGTPPARVEQLQPQVDPVRLQACLGWLASAPCGSLSGSCSDLGCDPEDPDDCGSSCPPTPCRGVFQVADPDGEPFVPPAAADERCDRDSDCAAGLFCYQGAPPDGGGQLCGVCKPKGLLGDDCAHPPYVPCGPGLFCDHADGGRCAQLRAEGETCTSSAACRSEFCSNGHCLAGGHPGAPCVDSAGCREGHCSPATLTCQPRLANGEPCTVSDQCLYQQCDIESGRCGKPLGASCTGPQNCQSRFCGRDSPRVCLDPLPLGTACLQDDDCQSGRCGTDTPRQCLAPKALGEPCTGNTDCASKRCGITTMVCAEPCGAGGTCPEDQYCDRYSLCVAQLADGSRCSDDAECLGGWCSDEDDRCRRRPQTGDACSDTGDCPPGTYCSGRSCVAMKGPNEPCAGYDSCMAPYVCLGGVCTPMGLTCSPAPVGQRCTWLSVCADDAYCDPLADFICKPRQPVGAQCSRLSPCRLDAFCDAGVCAPLIAQDQPCSRTGCAAGLFCDQEASPSRCTAQKSWGESCSQDAQCLTRNCQTGVCLDPGQWQVCEMPPPGKLPICEGAKSCADLGVSCGTIDDGCGWTVPCGTCTLPQTCGGGGQSGVCGCTPTTCDARHCGVIDDGCGGTIDCAGCEDDATCAGGGTNNVCGCPSDAQLGPNGATSARDLASVGTESWRDPASAAGEDSVSASVTFTGFTYSPGKKTHYLVASGFGLNLPAGAVINGIDVELLRRAVDAHGSNRSIDHSVRLFKGDAPIGASRMRSTWTAYLSWDGFGGTHDLWGHPWTAAELNDPDFGVGLELHYIGWDVTAEVDHARVTVHYARTCACQPVCTGKDCGDDGCGGQCGTCEASDTCSPQGVCIPPIYVDPNSGLQWQNSGSYSQAQDIPGCSHLTLGGHSDWRTPTLDELRTLIRGCPATETGGACGATDACSASTCAGADCAGCVGAGPGPGGVFGPPQLRIPISLRASTSAGTGLGWNVDLGSGSVTATPNSQMYGKYWRCVRRPE